jgi:FkbM family methyltransferase
MRALIERNTPVRSVIKTEPVQRALHAVRGCRAVDHGRPGFVYRQLRGTGVAAYRLRNGITIYVRHGSPDMTIFTRIFWRRMYEPPREIRKRLLGELRVVDLGANIGLFSASLGRRATVTAVEADPENAVLLRRLVATNHLSWQVIQAYAANEAGITRFAGGRRCLSKAAPDGEEVEKLDVFPLFDGADLLKMDIEGGEWDILADPRFAEAPPILVMEWHSERCPSPNARLTACELLREAGYTSFQAPDTGIANGHLWAWRDY